MVKFHKWSDIKRVPSNADQLDKEISKELKDLEDMQSAHIAELERLSKELDIPISVASDVFYLRTRERHNQAMENELLRLWREEGKRVNIMEWPPSDSPLRIKV